MSLASVPPSGSIQSNLANQDVGFPLTDKQREEMRHAAAKKIEELFDILMIDYRNDHNTCETPARVARMMVDETLRGRYEAPPTITEFLNFNHYDQMIVTGPIDLRSTCSHHLMPIYGHVIIGIIPSPKGKIIGLSKYDRIVEYFASRLQIQEELVMQIENHIVQKTKPDGLAVRINAVHMCKCHRGVKSTNFSRMVNSSFYGELKTNERLQSEFVQQAIALETNGK